MLRLKNGRTDRLCREHPEADGTPRNVLSGFLSEEMPNSRQQLHKLGEKSPEEGEVD